MKKDLNELVRSNGTLDLSSLQYGIPTKYICITGPNSADVAKLCEKMAEHYSKSGMIVVTAKALHNEKLSDYIDKLRGYCKYFIYQGGTIDEYVYEVSKTIKDLSKNQDTKQTSKFAPFQVYLHLDCDAKTLKDIIAEHEFLNEEYNVPIDTSRMSEEDVLVKALSSVCVYMKYID
jgi:hypothetical protein